jgi:predicted nucleotide-binding protein
VATVTEEGKLRIFIGSSGEARPVVRILEKEFKSSGFKVIPWDSDDFRIGGRFFLDLLLKAPDEYDFDFAIFIFRADDAISSRNTSYYTPRDNVLFELGIFMSRLGAKRTFLLAPKPWEVKLKILSDLQNYIPDYYDPPARAKTKGQRLANLQAALKPAIQKIKGRIDKLGPRDTQRLEQVAWVSPLLGEYFKARIRGGRVVKNLALDLGATWNIFHTLFERHDVRNITVQTLMMDGHSEEIITASGQTPTATQALLSEAKLVAYCKSRAAEMKKRRILLECRAYPRVPFVHGFLMRRFKLLLTTLLLENGKMVGTPNPYWELDFPKSTSRNRTARHSFAAYEEWFDEQWSRSRRVWPEA